MDLTPSQVGVGGGVLLMLAAVASVPVGVAVASAGGFDHRLTYLLGVWVGSSLMLAGSKAVRALADDIATTDHQTQ